MSMFGGPVTRRLLPRWKAAGNAASAGELDAARQDRSFDSTIEEVGKPALRDLIEQFELEPTYFLACEIVSSASALGERTLAVAAAEFVISNGADDGLAKSFARSVLSKQEISAIVVSRGAEALQEQDEVSAEAVYGKNIRSLKNRLSGEHRDPYAWVDLSRLYAAVGSNRKALRAMKTALGLARADRFVMRSAVRLLTHLDVPDEAAALLRSSPRLLYDPWLLSADIALATVLNKVSRNLRRGLEMLGNRAYSELSVSELAGAIGTVEALSGQRKRSERLFRQALRAPTENLLAQVEFAARVMHLNIESSPEVQVPMAFEADAWRMLNAGDNNTCVLSAAYWQRDEPYSSRAPVLATAVSAVSGVARSLAIRIGKLGLLAAPVSASLLNNLAFIYADDGDLKAAEAFRSRLPTSSLLQDHDAIAWHATGGLIAFRRGELDIARAAYGAALSQAQRTSDRALVARVLAFWAAEEVRLGLPMADSLARMLDDVATQRSSDPYLRLALERFERARRGATVSLSSHPDDSVSEAP